MKGKIESDNSFYLEISYTIGSGFSDKMVKGKLTNREALLGDWYYLKGDGSK
jgi:hypothetical protein